MSSLFGSSVIITRKTQIMKDGNLTLKRLDGKEVLELDDYQSGKELRLFL